VAKRFSNLSLQIRMIFSESPAASVDNYLKSFIARLIYLRQNYKNFTHFI